MNSDTIDMTDGERVVCTANQLDTSEFEVFRRSYHDWYGRAPDEKALEGDFVQYLYFGAAPPWVRNYTRNFLADTERQCEPPRRDIGASAMLKRLVASQLDRFLPG